MLAFRLRGTLALTSLWMLSQGLMCAAEENLKVEVSTHCLPEASNTIKETLPSPSETACAIMCHRFNGLAFVFTGELCDIRGFGLAKSKHTSAFRKLPEVTSVQLQDISRGKPTESLSLYTNPDAGPSKAVDDDITTMYHSASNYPRPWWLLDMEDYYLVYTVDVLTRQDSWGFRFHDIEIRVGDTPRVGEDFSSWALLGEYKGPYTLAEGRLNFTSATGLCGRYVVIHKISADTDYLQLQDVKIYVGK